MAPSHPYGPPRTAPTPTWCLRTRQEDDMKRTAFLLLATSSVLFLLSNASARTRPRQGGTLRVEMRADASQWMNSARRPLVFDSLTTLDSNGNVQPSLAARWESQSDDRRWQFWLRADVRFHDG